MKGNIVRSESRNKGTVSVLVQLKHTSKVTHIQSDTVVCNMAKQMQSLSCVTPKLMKSRQLSDSEA